MSKNNSLRISKKIRLVYIASCALIGLSSCSNNGSNKVLETNSVHSKSNEGSSYQKNQKSLVTGEENINSSNPLETLKSIDQGNTTVYIDKSSPSFNTKECFYPYISKKTGEEPQLFLKIRYVGEEWIEIKNIIITADSKDYTFKNNKESIKEETKGKKAYKIELFERPLSNEEIESLQIISNSKKISGFLVGKNKYITRVISQEQKVAFKNVLRAYNSLKQNL